MATVLPFILIIASLTVIIIVIARKYPQLTLLDVDNAPDIKEEKKKDELVKRRAEERINKARETWSERLRPMKQGAEKSQQVFRRLVGKVQQRVDQEEQKKKEERGDIEEALSVSPDELRLMVQDGMAAFEQERYEDAEKQFIAAIRLDMKNKDAYRGLGDVYFAQGQHKEAEETYKFLLHLDSGDPITYVRLADIAEQKKDLTAAVEYMQEAILLNDGLSPRYIRLADLLVELEEYLTALESISQAVELEPENPRYLDKLIEIGVLCGRKDIAEDGYQRLRMVNPENKKLDVFKDKIRQMK